ncbi:MAG: ABC transporter permease subunit [Actinophytocola sp.]|uniref:ABC transporter permease n=1 Tax=Actinophytocola sp. TaxID=1872138 RepID=UPI0013269063|nr:ABC transporter permease subunit [Actinophytocola sp.]MPZ79459.1 ABC transporter permease subunit [Actinophytocola sp.]
MTAVAVPVARAVTRTTAPISRLLRAELRFMLRRPRTLIALGLVALVPVVAGIGISVASTAAPAGPGQEFQGVASIVADNGMILPVFTLLLSVVMLLPMLGTMWSADTLAGEAATGGLRNLLLAPVGRARLLAVKAFGVAVLCLLAVTVLAVVGVVAGMTILGGDGMLTMSGTTLPFGQALGRVALLALLVTIQMWAVAAVALAISACTDHPLVVLATTLGGIIVFTVLGAISSLDWLHPVLITNGWEALADVARDPMPTDAITDGLLRAACYVVIGYSLALARLVTRDG